MKVVLFGDPQFIRREGTVLRRLVVGLVGEMVKVLQIMPGQHDQIHTQAELTGKTLYYEHSTLNFIRDFRLNRLLSQIEAQEPDVLHALNAAIFPAVAIIARKLNLPVVCSLWSEIDANRIKIPTDINVLLCSPTKPIDDQVKHHWPNVQTQLTPPGVYLASDEIQPPLADPQGALCFLVIGDGKRDHYYKSMLEGFARVRQQLPQAMFFLYAVRGNPHQLWEIAAHLDLLSYITMIQPDEDMRKLLVQVDVVIQPQPNTIVRTLLLEGMAAARPVIANACPIIDYLVDQQTAMILNEPTPDQWAQHFLDIAHQPTAYIKLGRSARQYVKDNHSAAAYVQSIMDAYNQIATPEPIPFKTA